MRLGAFGVLLSVVATACGGSPAPSKKLIILGVDGFDPGLLEQYAKQGRTPNLRRLMASGRYSPLGTSNPPQSPVAWSDFITGHESDVHGIYDFVHRDPTDRRPYLSTSRTEPPQTLALGRYTLPVGGGGVKLLREGRAFWELLGERGIPATIFKVPANYPPAAGEGSRAISGMGTPDLLGTYGTFQAYTDDRSLADEAVSGGQIHLLDFAGGARAVAPLSGPPDPFEAPHAPMEIPLEVRVDRKTAQVVVTISDSTLLLGEGEWSPWLPVAFAPSLPLPGLSGMVRICLLSAGPRVLIYVTPINVDPRDPALPISTDEAYLDEIVADVGLFYSQGMPEDTKALEAGILSDARFLEQADLVFEERRRLLEWHLEHFDSGLLFFYFSSVDQTSHVFYRSIVEDASPEDARYAGVLPSLYERVDAIVGEVMERMDDQTTLIVMSDHGFAPWTWEVSLNAWLEENGYLTPYPERPFIAGSWNHVDWVKTKAYAVGLNQIFLNLEGREGTGFVPPEERDRLTREIAGKLERFIDPNTGRRVVTKVYTPPVTDHPERTPDLIVGFARGYRSSNESAIGDPNGPVIRRNRKKWSGDHCMDPSHVPGVFLTTGTLTATTGKLTDLAPTVLDYFGVPVPRELDGLRLLGRED